MKIAIIGCAHMQAKIYTAAFQKEEVEILGVYDHNTLRGSLFAKEFKLRFYNSLDKILTAPIDAVLICSENSLHYDHILAATFYKKHIIVEKPLALTVREAQQMIIACQKAQVKLLVAHPIRFSKTVLDLKTFYEEGRLGTIQAINGTNRGKNPGGWFLDKELSGGGAILDHMVHLVDLSHWLFQFEVASIAAHASSKSQSEIEDSGLINITFTNGVIFSLDTSWNRPENYPIWGDVTLEIVSDRGLLFVDAIGRKGNYFPLEDSHQHVTYEDDMDSSMIHSFIQCIENDQAPTVTGEDGLYTVKIASLAYLSLQLGRVIYREEFETLLNTKIKDQQSR